MPLKDNNIFRHVWEKMVKPNKAYWSDAFKTYPLIEVRPCEHDLEQIGENTATCTLCGNSITIDRTYKCRRCGDVVRRTFSNVYSTYVCFSDRATVSTAQVCRQCASMIAKLIKEWIIGFCRENNVKLLINNPEFVIEPSMQTCALINYLKSSPDSMVMLVINNTSATVYTKCGKVEFNPLGLCIDEVIADHLDVEALVRLAAIKQRTTI